jgi:20S proteasome subunit alpha 5
MQNHRFIYNEPMNVESVSQSICDLALRFGEGAHGEESLMVFIHLQSLVHLELHF